MELDEALRHIETFPYSASEILPDTKGEVLVYRLSNQHYQALAHWLRNLLLGELLNIEVVRHFPEVEPFARLWKARFDLLTGLVPRHEYLSFVLNNSPVRLWFLCIAAYAKMQVHSLGHQVTRKSFTEGALAELDILEGLNPSSSVQVVINPGYEWLKEQWKAENIWSYATATAAVLADDCDFFAENYFEPWLRAERRIMRQVRRQKGIVFAYLSEGEIKRIGKGKRKRKQM